MPSTVVHVALAGLLATALLGEQFDTRAVLVVVAATIFVDLDVFVGWWIPGAHRAAFHTLLLPFVVSVALYIDTHFREESAILSRWGTDGVRVAWVSVAAVVFSAIGLDLFYNGVNLFYPLHDQFYDLSGRVFVSNQRGFVQTMFDLAESARGTTKTTHYSTGVDPTAGTEPKNVERIFPIWYSGVQFVIVLVGYLTVGIRLFEQR